MSNPIDISKLDKGAVLAALYNASQPLGMGFLHYDPKPMTDEEGRQEVADQIVQSIKYGSKSVYFDYLNGRVMKIELSGNELHPGGYDRDNGEGAALRALKPLLDAVQ